MITIEELDEELSLKLGDPVSNGADGELFVAKTRLVYLSNAIGRVYRVLPALMRVYAPLFTSSYIKHTQKIESSENIVLKKDDVVLSLENVKEVFVEFSYSESPTTSKATFIEPEQYLSVLNKETSAYDPSFEESNIYYTFLNHAIYLLPMIENGTYQEISTIMSEDAPEIKIDSEIKIPRKYKDLVLIYAALEGMEDIGRQDKVQLYAGDLNNQLSILKNHADFKTMKEGSEVNG